MHSDTHPFTAYCSECQEKRSVTCSIAEARSGKPILVGSAICGHSWTLGPKEAQAVREQIAAEHR